MDNAQFHSPSRRDFNKALAAGGLGAAAAVNGRLLAGESDKPLFKISVAQWSLHRMLKAGELDHLDFAGYSKDQFGINAVEYVNQFFKDKAEDAKYIAEMKKRAADLGVKNLLIMCDGEGKLGDRNLKQRLQAVENHYKWVTAAKELGCHSIRVNAASEGTYEEQLGYAADGLRALTEFATDHEMNVLVENHGGLSSDGAWLAAVMEAVDLPRCGTLPDFGNFHIGDGNHYNRYLGVMQLMPFAKAVSAKSHEFDAQGNETKTDFLRMMKIVLDAGYGGYVGIEFEGSGISEPDGVLATKKLLQRVHKELA